MSTTQTKRLRIKKILFTIGLVIMAGSVSGYYGVDYYFSQLELKKKSGPRVLGMPADYMQQPIDPYDGPHPSTLERPQDAFQYPIQLGQAGPSEPLFSGPKQYPFLCDTERSGLGQPLVDNQDGIGIAVYQVDAQGNKTEKVIGYSKDCKAPTTAEYYYKRLGGGFYPLSEANNDIAQIQYQGRSVDFVVRVEIGVINRYIYAFAVLKGDDETIESPNGSNWNQRLVYQFRGGVGIGRRQGKFKAVNFLNRRKDVLEKGYAVAFSTGTQTKHHYNVWLSEEIVMRIKQQLTSLYGAPQYTFGIGGSGGAIQQYLLAQNHPGLIDAAVALYAYPDMVTQMTYAFDCELLEYYFDVLADDNPLWDEPESRIMIEGLNAKNDFDNKYSSYYNLARLVNGVSPVFAGGMTECVNGWRGLVQLTNNPQFVHFSYAYETEVMQQTHWTHWEDLVAFYGRSPEGYARQAWDNVGVQYGLQALKEGQISPEIFLDLNRKVGGWKPSQDFKQERYWKVIKDTALNEISPWSQHNMTHDGAASEGEPAPRSVGDIDAIRAIFKSGHVFLGQADIPIIDVRHYLEDELDMHHLSASFVSRTRMQHAMGHADNQLIWVTKKPHNPILQAFDLLERWLDNRALDPNFDVVASKPTDALDRCFDDAGEVIAEGSTVWNGAWNEQPNGACMQAYPSYLTSRLVAGEGWSADTFKCQTQPVAQALEQGVYGDIDMGQYLDQLQTVFPDGVCDYRQPAIGLEVLSELNNTP